MTSKLRGSGSHARVDSRLRIAGRALVAALWLCSCGGGSAQFDVRQASDAPRAPLVISLLGAYDGSMNDEAGAVFARDISRSLGHESCTVAFGETEQRANPDTFSAFETEVDSNGVDDELLRMIAPAADGKVILVLAMSGRLTKSEDDAAPPSRSTGRTAPASSGRGPSRGGGMSRHSPRSAPRSPPPSAAPQALPDLLVSASFYSVPEQRTVSNISMRYTGSDLADGLRLLAQQLATLFPNTVCRPWNWAHVRVEHELDSAGLPLTRFHLVRTDHPERRD